MKFFLLLSLQIVAVFCQEQRIRIAAECFYGTVALPPKEHLNCTKSNEEFACAYGEGRCDGFLYCGTPPCHWRCWCKPGFKRLGDGCVKFCPQIAIKDPILIN